MATVESTGGGLRIKKAALAKREAKSYVNPYYAGILLGLVLFAAFFITGGGLSASGGMNNIIVWVEKAIAPQHVNTTAYLAGISGGVKNATDSWTVWMLAGALIGGALSGLIHGRTKIEINKGPQINKTTRLLTAFAGGSLMGFGARLARGCTSGQALSGGAVLSVGSWAFMFAVFGGGYMLAYFVRKLWN